MTATRIVQVVSALVFVFAFSGCVADDSDEDDAASRPIPNGDDDDALADDDADDDTWPPLPDDDSFSDDDASDDDADDDADDDSGDDDTLPPNEPNPNAKADAFKLFYRERVSRIALAFNRFALSGDAVFGAAIGKNFVARSGNEYEVVPGPNDNNPIGMSTWGAWKLYQAIGGRDLELTLIRMFEGLAFYEAVTGHPGLTVREALPGWTRVMDGVADTVTRTRDGAPIGLPDPNAPALEQEILDTFYDGIVVTYREDPLEYYFNFKPVNEVTEFSITMVFEELPNYLRISNCCSSWMHTQKGDWIGAWWGNHNSRDNMTDYVMGYIAAFEAEAVRGLPADLAAAATKAANAARRVGDTTVANGNIQMTVDERFDYETLSPAGEVGPDGLSSWQDLGSISSCPMAYLARAISTPGLSSPVPAVPLPGAIERDWLIDLFHQIGIDLPLPVWDCRSVDDAFVGLTWGDILTIEIFGTPLPDVLRNLAAVFPDLFPDLFGGMMDDFKELELGAVGLAEYAQLRGDAGLYDDARQTLWHLIEIQRLLAEIVYGLGADAAFAARYDTARGPGSLIATIEQGREMMYIAAMYARMFDLPGPLADFDGWYRGEQKSTWLETPLAWGDTAPWGLITDEQIAASVEAALPGEEAPVIQRYRDRFGYTRPVRRAGDGYERIGPDGDWGPAENPRHQWYGDFHLWFEAALCTHAPATLDCSWARVGCAVADLDGDTDVDADDRQMMVEEWAVWGTGASCDAGNDWCDGIDLDRDGTFEIEDRDFMDAAQGCVI
ncbi:MAG: hypothetical protein IT350_00940 [Deltaproteobacteria bacterium]|nr:hypothetical protein [Deltaproteobacteria bacterium]